MVLEAASLALSVAVSAVSRTFLEASRARFRAVSSACRFSFSAKEEGGVEFDEENHRGWFRLAAADAVVVVVVALIAVPPMNEWCNGLREEM